MTDPIVLSIERQIAVFNRLERQLDTLPPPTPEQAMAVIRGLLGDMKKLAALARAVAAQNAELETRLAQIAAATGQKRRLS